ILSGREIIKDLLKRMPVNTVIDDVSIDDVRSMAVCLHAIMQSPVNKQTLGWNGGKHVVVSLGSRGALWVGPRTSVGYGSTVHVVNDTTACFYAPAVPMDEGISISITNGAGDGFCAGIIGDIVNSGQGMTQNSI